MQPDFTNEDVARIAAHLSITEELFIATYLEIDPLTGEYRTKTAPCRFLGGDDRCTIYEVRPEACRDFPHTNKEGFTQRVHLHLRNALTCPAVYHLVKGLRRSLRHR